MSPLPDRLLDHIMCPTCFRWTYSPVHLLVRAMGLCPGAERPPRRERKRP